MPGLVTAILVISKFVKMTVDRLVVNGTFGNCEAASGATTCCAAGQTSAVMKNAAMITTSHATRIGHRAIILRDRAGAIDVPGGVLLLGANVDQDGLAAGEPLAQFIAPHPLDVLAEVVTRSPLHLGQSRGGGFA